MVLPSRPRLKTVRSRVTARARTGRAVVLASHPSCVLFIFPFEFDRERDEVAMPARLLASADRHLNHLEHLFLERSARYENLGDMGFSLQNCANRNRTVRMPPMTLAYS